MSVLPIQRTTVATLIAEDMRDHLLSGAIAPGTLLGDKDLAEASGAPVGTVRAALAELERDGLVVHSLHRGLEVMPMTRAELRDIYAARRVFERAGLEALLATRPVDVSWLQAAVERMGEASVAGDHRALVESEMAFHLALAAAAGSSRVTRAARSALMELRLVLPVADRSADDLPALVADHQYLATVFSSGYVAESTAALEDHLVRGEALARAGIVESQL
jgi:DNA-binding GntR family transcriptional regulator